MPSERLSGLVKPDIISGANHPTHGTHTGMVGGRTPFGGFFLIGTKVQSPKGVGYE
jgi:hypothetical protein